MSEDEKNRELYKGMFEEIPVPEGLAEKVGRIPGGEEKSRRTAAGSVMRKVAIAAAVLVVLFVGSNGIAYAMTGSAWIETVAFHLKLKGIEYEVDLTEEQTRNGETIYTGVIKEADGDESHVHIFGEDGEVMILTSPSAGLMWWGDKVYIQDEELEIDVTEQLEEKGYATGTYEKNGFMKQYAVKKVGDHFDYRVETLYEGMTEMDWVTEWLEKDFSDEKTQVFEAVATPTPVP